MPHPGWALAKFRWPCLCGETDGLNRAHHHGESFIAARWLGRLEW